MHKKIHAIIAIAIIIPMTIFATVRSITSPEASKARFEREITKREAIAQGKIQAVESYLLELEDFAEKEYKLCEEPSEIFKRIEEAIYDPKAELQEEPKIEQAKKEEKPHIEEKPYIPSFEEEQKKKVVSRAVEFM
jgi:CHASE1-domain containing sensor protein